MLFGSLSLRIYKESSIIFRLFNTFSAVLHQLVLSISDNLACENRPTKTADLITAFFQKKKRPPFDFILTTCP
jgi:hypothetical protein